MAPVRSYASRMLGTITTRPRRCRPCPRPISATRLDRLWFDHAVSFYEQAWYHGGDEDWWRPRPEQAIEYLTRLFQNPEPLADEFADSQIGQGLYYLIDNGAGAHCAFLIDGSVPIEARVACIESMQPLFARLFQPRCAPVLSHLDEPGGDRLNQVCYMWWDIIPLAASSKPRQPDPIHEASLSVMRDTLRLPNPRVSGECAAWPRPFGRMPSGALRLPRSMLISPPIRSCDLRLVRYAQAARAGCVN